MLDLPSAELVFLWVSTQLASLITDDRSTQRNGTFQHGLSPNTDQYVRDNAPTSWLHLAGHTWGTASSYLAKWLTTFRYIIGGSVK